MAVASINAGMSAGGKTITSNFVRSGDAAKAWDPALPTAFAGTLTTRTDDDTGVVTVAASPVHDLIVGDRVTVFWAAGRRYAMLVSAVTDDAITVGTGVGDVGAGDVFPAQDTVVQICKEQQVNVDIHGSTAKVIGVQYVTPEPSVKAHFDFLDSGDARIHEITQDAGDAQIWDIEGGATNDFSGNNVTQVWIATNSTSTTIIGQALILSLEDNTP